jgi:predicted PurR-regulated permease PerM
MLSLARDFGFEETISSALNGLSNEASKITSDLGAISVGAVTGLFSGIMNAFFVLIITFFMLIEGPNWLKQFWKYVYRDGKKRTHHQEIADKMYHVISTFVTSQVIIATINAVLAGIGVFVLAMTFGFTMSLILPISSIVFISTFIPMFGPIIGSILTGILVLLYNPIAAIIFVVYLILFQQVVYNILSPKIQGKRMNMSPLIVLIAMIAGLQIGGVLGALIAIPIAGCVVVIIRETIKHRLNNKPTKKSRPAKV